MVRYIVIGMCLEIKLLGLPKGKGIFPTIEQIKAGQVNFKRDGSGTEFDADPSLLYGKAFEVNSDFNYSDSTEYYVRIAAVYEDGASPISYAAKANIPFDTFHIYDYIFNDIPISSSEELDDEHLNIIYQNVIKKGLQGRVIVEDSYQQGLIVDGPYYKTHSNVVARALISAVSGWISGKIPKVPPVASKAVTIGTFIASEYAAPVYTGTWTYKAYDKILKKDRIYVTLVHYKYGNYTSPIKVQSYPVTN